MMTLQDLKDMTKAVITPAEAAQVIGCDPQYIRVAAEKSPHLLKFPTFRIGRNTKIPRIAFIRYMEGQGKDEP